MPSASSSRSGFTLFELLLVIILIAVLYGIFINKLSTGPKRGGAEAVTLQTLDTLLQPFAREAEADAALVCTDRGRKCEVYVDGARAGETSVALFDDEPQVYARDGYGQFRPLTFAPVEDDDGVVQDVCFRYTLRANGSRSSYIVGDGGVFYLFDAYLQPVTTYKTLEEAETAYEREALIPDDERSYTF